MNNKIQFEIIDPRAVVPTKAMDSDSGYDVTIIDNSGITFGHTTLYRTGLKVKPPKGWYMDLVPRSSIIKTGYMLSNSIGVLDSEYRGEILVALRKIDFNMPDIELPIRIAQLIPRPIEHFDVEVVDNLDNTDRGEGGFGSTG